MALSLQRYSTWSDPDKGIHRLLIERIQKERETSVVIAVNLGDSLPEALIIEILSWLPVKALLQFKTVCKSWHAIISTPAFVSKHLQKHYNHSSSDCLLTQHLQEGYNEIFILELLLDETPKVLAHQELNERSTYDSFICGPCNGIYLYMDGGSNGALWNPAINERKTLPPMVEKSDLRSKLTRGLEVHSFGYDPSTDDYKVVVIRKYYFDECTEVRVFIYSLKADSWKFWGDLSQVYAVSKNKSYIYLNGCCYWRGFCDEYRNTEIIICFDLIGEAYKEIQVPNHVHQEDYLDPRFQHTIGVYRDTLAFLCVDDVDKYFDICTFDDGVWTNKFRMGPVPNLWHPIGHWKDDKFLLDDKGGNVLLCDTTTAEIKDLEYQQRFCSQGAYVYKESLVSFKGYENNKDTTFISTSEDYID